MFLFGIAWWGHSHIIIAGIAKTYLTSKQSKRITKAINGFGLPKADILSCSTWQDDVKSQGFYQMGTWHFRNEPIVNGSGEVTVHADTYDVVSYLKDLIQVQFPKHQPRDLWALSFALRSLIHFVGDVHCPVHAANFYSEDFPTGDKGGSAFPLNCRWGESCANIHAMWDSAGFAYPLRDPLREVHRGELERNISDLLRDYPASGFGGELEEQDPGVWMAESNRVARDFVYAVGLDEPVSEEYIEQAREESRRRIALAGHRLGRVLRGVAEDGELLGGVGGGGGWMPESYWMIIGIFGVIYVVMGVLSWVRKWDFAESGRLWR